jgi:hypothetical protein
MSRLELKIAALRARSKPDCDLVRGEMGDEFVCAWEQLNARPGEVLCDAALGDVVVGGKRYVGEE